MTSSNCYTQAGVPLIKHHLVSSLLSPLLSYFHHTLFGAPSLIFCVRTQTYLTSCERLWKSDFCIPFEWFKLKRDLNASWRFSYFGISELVSRVLLEKRLGWCLGERKSLQFDSPNFIRKKNFRSDFTARSLQQSNAVTELTTIARLMPIKLIKATTKHVWNIRFRVQFRSLFIQESSIEIHEQSLLNRVGWEDLAGKFTFQCVRVTPRWLTPCNALS